MTTTREVLEDRWQMLLRDVERYRAPDGTVALDATLSKRYYRIANTLEELATRMAGDDLVADESERIDTLIHERIWPAIKAAMIEWAMEIEQARAERDAAREKAA